MSSASGSKSLRAIEIALRNVKSRSGNSSAASGEPLYTDAPDSDTTAYDTGRSSSFISSATKISDSLDAVPLPMEMQSTPYLFISALSVALDSSIFFCGGVG